MKKTIAAFITLILIFTSAFSYTTMADSTYNLIKTCTDTYYMFSFKCPDYVTIKHTPDLDNPLFELIDSKNKLSAKISFDKIDESVIQNARDYFGDTLSSDNDIFNYIVKYKDSFLTALEESLEKNFIYGSNDETTAEPYIKMIRRYTENFYDVDSYISLYNTIEYDSSSAVEQTNLNVLVPSYKNKIIYTFNFSIEKGKLNSDSINSILNILNAFEIQNHIKQTVLPEVLNDYDSINLANEGIYPKVEIAGNKYNNFDNKAMGYRIKYPASFLPYKETSFMNSIQYKSFRISSNIIFSIRAEKDSGNDNTLQNHINSLSLNNTSNTKIDTAGVDKFGSRYFIYVKYISEVNDTPIFTTEYYTSNNGMLYTLQLQSEYSIPSAEIIYEYLIILGSMEFSLPETDNSINKTYMNWYNSDQNNFELLFPNSWVLSNASVESATYNSLILKNPAMSSSFEIQIHENDLIKEISYEDALKLSNASESEYSNFFIHKVPYYIGKPIASTFTYNNGVSRIVRLVNYIDENGRARICSTITIAKGKKAYTMFIKMSEYSLAGFQLFEPSLIPMINSIAESFAIK